MSDEPEVVLMNPDGEQPGNAGLATEPISIHEMLPNVLYRNVGTTLHPRLVPVKMQDVKPCEVVFRVANADDGCVADVKVRLRG